MSLCWPFCGCGEEWDYSEIRQNMEILFHHPPKKLAQEIFFISMSLRWRKGILIENPKSKDGYFLWILNGFQDTRAVEPGLLINAQKRIFTLINGLRGPPTHTHTSSSSFKYNISTSPFHKAFTNYFYVTSGYLFVIRYVMKLPLGVFNKQNALLTFAGHPSKPSQRATDHLIFRLDVHFMLVINGTASTQYWQQCRTMPRNARFWTYVMTNVHDAPYEATSRYKVLTLALDLSWCLLLFYL